MWLRHMGNPIFGHQCMQWYGSTRPGNFYILLPSLKVHSILFFLKDFQIAISLSNLVSNMERSDYFLRFPAFERTPTESLTSEFNRLARQMNWKSNSKRFKKEKAAFFASEFNTEYGTNATKLESWQALCYEVDIFHSIESIAKCRKVLNLTLCLPFCFFTSNYWPSRH